MAYLVQNKTTKKRRLVDKPNNSNETIVVNVTKQLEIDKSYKLSLSVLGYAYDLASGKRITIDDYKKNFTNRLHTRITTLDNGKRTSDREKALNRCAIAIKTNFKEWSTLEYYTFSKYNCVYSISMRKILSKIKRIDKTKTI